MDFTQPQATQSISGFPVTFREVILPGRAPVWVPRGISRHPLGASWRLYVVHEGGLITTKVEDDPCPLSSLSRAFALLVESLEGVVSRFVVDKRNRGLGFERDPLIDTGYTGVVLSRTSKPAGKRVEVSAMQMVRLPDGRIDSRNFYAGSIKEESVMDDPVGQSTRLHELIRKAVAARRYYNRQRSLGVYSTAAYKYLEVPDDIRRQHVEAPDLDIVAIMDSFIVVPRERRPKTTFGDPDALAARLQARDLTEPHADVWLEGRNVKFYKRLVEGRTFFIPTGLYRARGEWRVRVIHTEGVFSDSVPDADCEGCMLTGLREAWTYLVSLYREYPATTGRDKPVKHPLLDTGIPGFVVQPAQWVSEKTGDVSWSFSLKVNQRTESVRNKTLTLSYLRLDRVTGKALSHGLRHGAAVIAYRAYLLGQGASLDQAFVGKEAVIPGEFWPAEPVCTITAADLFYYVDQRPRTL
ncbi:hypothetical protein [Marinobacter sp. ELB17]|uniref:hypothetical protein n=1 Tax=Marinobacter sp. ELB17 TaxID=270374 RepID=UPI0000F381F6|nr:hypothetical protein [Marinobacter sp. ELB17]EAZ98135.1 hypothetical protein MELB17_09633 [Marinobacter sp. ELB17]